MIPRSLVFTPESWSTTPSCLEDLLGEKSPHWGNVLYTIGTQQHTHRSIRAPADHRFIEKHIWNLKPCALRKSWSYSNTWHLYWFQMESQHLPAACQQHTMVSEIQQYCLILSTGNSRVWDNTRWELLVNAGGRGLWQLLCTVFCILKGLYKPQSEVWIVLWKTHFFKSLVSFILTIY